MQSAYVNKNTGFKLQLTLQGVELKIEVAAGSMHFKSKLNHVLRSFFNFLRSGSMEY